jgi:glutaminyl-tRNA synthetase
MPTISGMRRRGVTPEAVRAFADLIGVAKANSAVDVGKLEFCIRDDLNTRAPRVLCVLDPIRVTIENFAADTTEWIDAPYWPEDIGLPGTRRVPMSRTILIDRSDFEMSPPKGWYRLAPGAEVRLRYSYLLRCTEVIHDDAGNVVELKATYDPQSAGGSSSDGRKVRGTIHWVSETHALPATVRLYDRLFSVERPDAEGEFLQHLNPDSLVEVSSARIEPNFHDGSSERYQFERTGFFFIDPVDSSPDALVFNRIITLKDGWARQQVRDTAVATTPEPAATARKSGDDRPARKTRAQERAWAREHNPALAGAFERLRAIMTDDDADVLSGDIETVELFEQTVAAGAPVADAVRLFINDVARVTKDHPVTETGLTAEALAELLSLQNEGVISSTAARTVFDTLVEEGGTAAAVVERRGLRQVSDTAAIDAIVSAVIESHADEVGRYRAGKVTLLGFLVGQAMKRSGGAADAALVRERMLVQLG